MRTRSRSAPHRQRGAAAVEFALILIPFLFLLLGIMEFGRLFFVINTAQEVTRRAAREQVVCWATQAAGVQRLAVFGSGTRCGTGSAGTVALPGGGEVTNATVNLGFYNTLADAVGQSNPIVPAGGSVPQSNVNNCLLNDPSCIRFVRASLQTAGGAPVNYSPMVGFFSTMLDIPLPGSTVIMPAEALGLL